MNNRRRGNWSRIISLLLSVFLLLALFPAITIPAWADTYNGDNIVGEADVDYSHYTFTYTAAGELQGCVDENDNGPAGRFVIPSEINGVEITSIAATTTATKLGFGSKTAANANTALTELVIPGSVRTIGDYRCSSQNTEIIEWMGLGKCGQRGQL